MNPAEPKNFPLWVLFPLRYLYLLLFRSLQAARMGNHCYMWLRKPL
jgi:hypothetical protein